MATTTADCIGTCFTTGDGIYNIWMDRNEVIIKFHSDTGDDIEHYIPAYKFAWVVADFMRVVQPILDADDEAHHQWLAAQEVPPADETFAKLTKR